MMFSSSSSTNCVSWSRQPYMSKTSLRSDVKIVGLDEMDIISNRTAVSLTFFQSLLFATVLEDAIAELNILEECNNTIKVSKAMCDMVVLMAKKYSVPKRTIGDDLDEIDSKNLDCLKYKLLKLEDDRKYVKDILVGTYADLAVSRRSQHLVDQVDDAVSRIKSRERLIQDEAANRVLRRDLNRQLRHQRNHIKSVHYDTDAVIQNLTTAVEDAYLVSNIRRRYVENWQQARTEQHLKTIDDKESKPLDGILYFKKKADQEQRVHTEVELLMNITINETLQKVEEWMNKYDKDMEAIDLKIQKKKNEYEDMLMKTENLEKMIEEHALQIKNWVTFKEEREKARLYREKMTEAAIAIQAWWRGLLVRNQLGPYKVAQRRPPPAPEGGAKKKKK